MFSVKCTPNYVLQNRLFKPPFRPRSWFLPPLLMASLTACQTTPFSNKATLSQPAKNQLESSSAAPVHNSIYTNSAQHATSKEIPTKANGGSRDDPKLPILEIQTQDAFELTEVDELIPELLQAYQLQTSHLENWNLPPFIQSEQEQDYTNLWHEIGDHSFLASAYKHSFEDYMRYYLRHKPFLFRVSQRAEIYLYHILQEVKRRNMPNELALLPIIESGFSPFPKSRQKAAGLWQFMPATGRMYGLNQNWWYDGRQDVVASTEAALDYLQKLYQMNQYDWLLALASYNGGIGNVQKAKRRFLKKNPDKTSKDINFWAISPYLPKETKHYVPQLLAVSYLFKHQARYDIQLHPIANHSYFEVLQLDKQISLKEVAEITRLKSKTLERLNAGYLRLAMPPQGPYKLALPHAAARTFTQAHKANPSRFEVNWTRHTIQPGDTLSQIAYSYKTSIRAIKQLNRLRHNRIRAGKTLLIPFDQNLEQLTSTAMAKRVANPTNHSTHSRSSVKVTHTVRSGDSLWLIGQQYQVSSRKIAQWNQLKRHQLLQVGQKLTLYVAAEVKQGQTKLTHTLRKGENLWLLAQRYRVSTQQLARWNGLTQRSILQPGQVLDIWI